MQQVSVGNVFMSYSRRDHEIMQRIVAFLRKRGIKAWVDNEKLIPGTPIWEEEIEKAIKGASAVIVVLSPDSKNSEWVRREISLADQNRKRIFPVLVRGDEDSSITLRLITRQYVDIRETELAGLNALYNSLALYLSEFPAELNQNVREKAEAESKAQEEQRRAEQKAEERLERERVEAENKAREVERRAEQKAEEARLAREKAETDQIAGENITQFSDKQEVEETVTNQKAEPDRKAKEEPTKEEELQRLSIRTSDSAKSKGLYSTSVTVTRMVLVSASIGVVLALISGALGFTLLGAIFIPVAQAIGGFTAAYVLLDNSLSRPSAKNWHHCRSYFRHSNIGFMQRSYLRILLWRSHLRFNFEQH